MIRLRSWCVAVGLWLARLGGWSLPVNELPVDVLVIPLPVLRMTKRTRELMAYENTEPNASGEAKRHRVLARLMKEGLSESHAALAVEVVKQRW